jgi:hypothetical protein
MLSAPHALQVEDPAALCVPPGHGVTAEVPAQEKPWGHDLQRLRLVDPDPPDVYDPGGQTSHELFPSTAAYWLSWPQLEHVLCPAVEKVPTPG